MLAVVTAENAGKLGKGDMNTAHLLAGPNIQHYHQAVALVVAETFEQARAAAHLVKVKYTVQKGRFDLDAEKGNAVKPEGESDPPDTKTGNFARGFETSPVKLDATYHTPDQSHAMMEPHASTAFWEGDKVTVYTSNQMVAWCRGDLAKTLAIPKEKVRVISPYVGGGFGSKLFLRADALLAALGARAAKRPGLFCLQYVLVHW